jgi:hypothetical protein
MLVCFVPQTGAALFVFFGGSNSAKSASVGGDNEATIKKLAVLVKQLVGAKPCAEPLYMRCSSPRIWLKSWRLAEAKRTTEARKGRCCQEQRHRG